MKPSHVPQFIAVALIWIVMGGPVFCVVGLCAFFHTSGSYVTTWGWGDLLFSLVIFSLGIIWFVIAMPLLRGNSQWTF